MKDDFLRIDLELLLCRHGRQRVLSALSEIEGFSMESLEQKLDNLRKRKAGRNEAKSRKSLVDILEADLKDQPDRLAEVRPLVASYENGNLLPSLKAVQRFLESRGDPKPNLKSRKLAGPAFLKALLRMDEIELKEFQRKTVDDGQSDYSLLSRAILGGTPRSG